jgi:hypothetical protein
VIVFNGASVQHGSWAPGLDHILESLLPTLALALTYDFTCFDIMVVMALFLIVEMVLSSPLYKLKVRRRPC